MAMANPITSNDQINDVLNLAKKTLGDSMIGAYLFGSFTIGGLKPQSDIDILIAVTHSIAESDRQRLISKLLDISGDSSVESHLRPVEVTIVRISDIVPWCYPPRAELVYGEWLRAEYEAGRIPPPAHDPDLAIVLTSARLNSLTLFGPSAQDLFDPIPFSDLRLAITQSLPKLLEGLKGDERNVLLTLARMWMTLSTGEIVSKDAAAQWVLERLPQEGRDALDLARKAYLGECNDDWTSRAEEVHVFVHHAEKEIGRLNTK
jgi:aminoglycoside 9-adenylyltransferase